MRTTSELAANFGLKLFGSGSIAITGVAISTEHVRPGYLFVALQGKNTHGLDHLERAIELGAVAVLSDDPAQKPIPNLFHSEPRKVAGLIAAEVFETSLSDMTLFAVTGTNGKTSTVFFLHELLNQLEQSSGLISSALVKVGNQNSKTSLTTPEAPRLHQLLAQMRESGQQHCAVEVSAQGLSRNRVDGLRFRVAGFTNLSRDHLDDYEDMASYLSAKSMLFDAERSEFAVVFIQDDYASALFDQIEIPKAGIGAGYQYEYKYQQNTLLLTGKHFLKVGVELSTLMAKNLVLAIVMLLEGGFSPRALETAVASMNTAVPGRLQRVSERSPAVFVDYAHTPQAVLESARELAQKFPELTVILAASGDRDKGKRAEMALAAAQFAKRIVITDQHPRSEDPARIRADLRAAIPEFSELEEIADPSLAVARAVEITNSGGAILWCGPGHLKYREVAGSKVMFDAVFEARRVLGHD
jgi:UDP-N-acetylmuramoyl-L-alanyl-D-glutamate--2,6-diaminopimelate ligase